MVVVVVRDGRVTCKPPCYLQPVVAGDLWGHHLCPQRTGTQLGEE